MPSVSSAAVVDLGLEPPVPISRLWRCDLDKYHEMTRTGAFDEDDPVELLEGWLVTKMPRGPRHSRVTQRLNRRLGALIGEGWESRCQDPITLTASEPEPDVVVARVPSSHEADDQHPSAPDVALVVEVSDTTLETDRGVKKRVYAEAGIPVYWIVNLQADRVEVYSEPFGTGEGADYRSVALVPPDGALTVRVGDREVGRFLVTEVLRPRG